MEKELERIKELVVEIRQTPEDVDGVVDQNTAEIMRIVNGLLVKEYELQGQEKLRKELGL